MRTGRPEEWTPDRIAELRRFALAGNRSAKEIAKEMGVSRSAILGKLHRLGIKAEAGHFKQPTLEVLEERRKRRAATEASKARLKRAKLREERMREDPDFRPRAASAQDMHPLPSFLGSLNIPFADLRPFTNLGENQCRFIADEPPGPLYLSCGNETLPGESYCGHCREIIKPKAGQSAADRASVNSLRIHDYHRSQKAA